MSIITGQELNKYYSSYKGINVTFTKEIIKATGLYGKQVYFKYKQGQNPCVIYSCSMSGAKIITSLDKEMFQHLSDDKNIISLRFSFIEKGATEPIFFFIQGKIIGYTPFSKKKPDLYFATIQYTQRPPDDLIHILGSILEAAINSKARAEERIHIDDDSNRRLNINLKTTTLIIDKIPRKCIVKDLSFSGAKVLLLGNAKFIVNKLVILKMELDNGRRIFSIPGICLRFDLVEGRKDIAALGIKFGDKAVPMEYKIFINEYITHIRTK